MPKTSYLDSAWVALADPTRRAILQRLTRGEMRVTELARPFAMSLNAVSKHIMVLEKARLVRRRREGREHFLSFDPRALGGVELWIQTQKAVWAERLARLDDLLQEEDRAAAIKTRQRRLK